MKYYSEAETIAFIEDLDPPRLAGFVRLQVVQPVQSEAGHQYREVDLARLRLLVGLVQDYALQDDALVMVMSLIDQLNDRRAEMEGLLRALAQEAPDVRARLRLALADEG
ncbi:MAG: hypothetical protein Q4G24_03325 [Paracoccus sp. (in: a-proteobacteria)]|uniref:hypothetical protein n=1 Tax=Paracoccus sp. TaxID=267 RepID=UPI0026DFB5C7|nr:hypothetical protein [Paracoccus sp. (in: a-proteobacteria)]MDO5620482.1 hypothetical protein [Paracoccus sp. (in: a-proteobacteria)]